MNGRDNLAISINLILPHDLGFHSVLSHSSDELFLASMRVLKGVLIDLIKVKMPKNNGCSV